MQPRYAILVGDGEAIERATANVIDRLGFVRLAHGQNWAFLAPQDAPGFPLGDRGWLLGWLARPSGEFMPLHHRRVVAVLGSGGHLLPQNYWGAYVALTCGRDGSCDIIRDPSGMIPCLYASIAGLRIFASDVDGLIAGGLQVPAIDWRGLALCLAQPLRPAAVTALAGVVELLPGAAMTWRTRVWSERMAWSPWPFFRREAAREALPLKLAEIVQQSVAAWAGAFPSILLALSGGLDSSIVAVCAQRQDTDLRSFTMATRVRSGDERVHARAMATLLGLPLEEFQYRIDDVVITRSGASRLPRPGSLHYNQAIERAVRAMSSNAAPDALMSGHGGDNVFCHLRSTAPVIDRWRLQGLGRGVVQSLRDLADMHGLSLPRVALAVLRAARRPVGPMTSSGSGFLDPAAAQPPNASQQHPWLANIADATPGELARVDLLIQAQAGLQAIDAIDMPIHIAPLLSQPIVEFCLTHPSWVWNEGGIDRAPVRQAFENRLPPDICRRTSKGGPGSFLIEIFDANRDALRALLLDGLLQAEGLIRRQEVEASLTDASPFAERDHLSLLRIAEAEAWARAWRARAVRSGLG